MQEYWSGLPFPSPGDLLDPGMEPGSPAFQADALTSEPPGTQIYSNSEIIEYNIKRSQTIVCLQYGLKKQMSRK